MTLLLGVDPGAHGAAALVECAAGFAFGVLLVSGLLMLPDEGGGR